MAVMMMTQTLVLFLFVCSSWAFTFDDTYREPDVTDFLDDIVDWIRSKNRYMKPKLVIKKEDCIIVNFGYTQELPYPQISLSNSSSISFSPGTHGMDLANRCWVGLVAGSELEHVDSIFETVDAVGEQIQLPAYAVFLLGNTENITVIRNHWTPPIVKIGFNNGRSSGLIFHFTCVGSWIPDESKLVLREGSVNKLIYEVCPSSFLKMATNQYPGTMEVDFEEDRLMEFDECPGVAWDWEILDTFFQNYNFTPTFQDNNYTWGWFDTETQTWNGAVEMVRNNSADMGATMFGCSSERSTVIRCSSILAFGYDYFNSKAPSKLPAATNILRIFTPFVWGLILISVTLFSFFMIFAAKIGAYFGINSTPFEDFLVPFRLPVPEYVGPHSVSGNLLLFPRGSSANFVFIVWSLFAAVISYGFLAIFRDILLVPVFDKPVDSARDVVKYGLIPFVIDGGDYQRTHMLNSPSADYQYIGSIVYVPTTWQEFERMQQEEILEDGTHVYIGSIGSYEKAWGEWHISKEHIGGLVPFSVYILNKKMIQEEEIARTILYFDQAGLMLGYEWKLRPIPDPIEKIQLAHIFIAFLILAIGTVLAIISFCLELCLGKKQIPEQKGGNIQTKGNGGKQQDMIVEDFEGLNT